MPLSSNAHSVGHSPQSTVRAADSRLRTPPGQLYSALALFLLVLLSFVGACSHPDDTWEHVTESGLLRVGMDASFPPFEYIAPDGTPAGFDVELARELGKRLQLEVQIIANIPYDGLYDALAIGRVDVVISALVVNPQRTADFAYSAPYFDAGQVLVFPIPPKAMSAGMADLAGQRLAVEFGSPGDQEARKWMQRVPGLEVLHYNTAGEALEALKRGEADAALVDHVTAMSTCADGSGFFIVDRPVVSVPYAVAVRLQSRQLLRAVNQALAGMQADGTLERLTARWLCSAG